MKCPLCDFKTVDEDNMEIHIENKHGLTVYRLVSKIHGKIQELEKEARQGMVADYRHGYSDDAELLKSLLEVKYPEEEKT